MQLTNPADQKFYRILEIIPGALVWLTFVLALGFSFLKPLWVIYFIIAFSLYWVIRILYLIIYLFESWLKMRQTIKVDWFAKTQNLPNWKDYYHLIFLPTYKEDIEVIRDSFRHLNETAYPNDKFIVILGGEEGDRDNFLKIARQIEQEFGHRFFKLLITVHPKGLPGEIPGKGSNISWMGHQVKKIIDEMGLPYEKIIVSSFDIDSCVHRQYFSYLTYKYLTHHDTTHTSFQPVAVYNNNIWDAPAALRVVASSTTFWLLTEMARPERLFTFSSHSMSFKALVEVGFWEKDIVTEDSRIFLQCFIHYEGNYYVQPMHIPISMDTVMSSKLWPSLKNQYKQIRRWGWSVEHFPYMVWHFWKTEQGKKISFWKKIRYQFNVTEGEYSWATVPILLFILGRLPLALAGPIEKSTVIAQNAPYALQWIMALAMIGLFVSAILSALILPPRQSHHSRFKWLIMVLQWILVPITLIIFGSIPSLDAQTHLMLGKHLGFNVTEKARV